MDSIDFVCRCRDLVGCENFLNFTPPKPAKTLQSPFLKNAAPNFPHLFQLQPAQYLQLPYLTTASFFGFPFRCCRARSFFFPRYWASVLVGQWSALRMLGYLKGMVGWVPKTNGWIPQKWWANRKRWRNGFKTWSFLWHLLLMVQKSQGQPPEMYVKNQT